MSMKPDKNVFDKIRTFRSLGDPGGALGQERVTVASRSPDSWQHMQERSICHILDPDTYQHKVYYLEYKSFLINRDGICMYL